jgi:hypothetical protein
MQAQPRLKARAPAKSAASLMWELKLRRAHLAVLVPSTLKLEAPERVFAEAALQANIARPLHLAPQTEIAKQAHSQAEEPQQSSAPLVRAPLSLRPLVSPLASIVQLATLGPRARALLVRAPISLRPLVCLLAPLVLLATLGPRALALPVSQASFLGQRVLPHATTALRARSLHQLAVLCALRVLQEQLLHQLALYTALLVRALLTLRLLVSPLASIVQLATLGPRARALPVLQASFLGQRVLPHATTALRARSLHQLAVLCAQLVRALLSLRLKVCPLAPLVQLATLGPRARALPVSQAPSLHQQAKPHALLV